MSETATLEKPESWLWHLLGLINPAIVMASNIVGGYWVASGFIYMLGLGPLLDMFFGRASKPKPPRESGRPFEALLYVHAFIQFAVLATLMYRASIDGAAWTTWGGLAVMGWARHDCKGLGGHEKAARPRWGK